MPRFVLLRHDYPPDSPRASHWDLMFEMGDVLRTWALAELPHSWQADPSKSIGAESVDAAQLADHRLAYLDYEGPISGDRGSVHRVDAGTFETVVDTLDRWEVRVSGGVVRGRIALLRVNNAQWSLTVKAAD